MEITYVLERAKEYTRVFAPGLFGFYLFGIDTGRLMQGVVPLTQHLLWRNKKECWTPKVAFDPTELLSTNKMVVAYELMSELRAPPLTAEGEFWENEQKQAFFVPLYNECMDEELLQRIIKECAQLK